MGSKELTTAEEEAMTKLWELGKGFVKDILNKYPEPKPAYNTVSTIIRILERKGYVSHNDYGTTYEYFPTVSKDEYRRKITQNLLSKYFHNSPIQLVSYFANEKKLSNSEIEELKKVIEKISKKGDNNE